MKPGWLLLVALFFPFGTSAQDDAAQGLASVSAERARIESIRQQQTTVLDADERACQSRFAVTDCVNGVSARRREMLSELRRQEASLHDMERRQRGADQLKLSEEKAQENARRVADIEAASPAPSEEERKLQQAEKIGKHAKPTGAATSAPVTGKKEALDPQDSAKARADYARRQEALAQRRQDRDKRLKERADAPASLPVSP